MGKLTKKEIELIEDFEYIIGSSCYNPKSVDGWTGEVGKEFRYAAQYQRTKKSTELVKEKGRLTDITPANVDTIRYVFGANHLYIGKALAEIIELLKERYDIDFDELEKECIKKRKLKQKVLQKELKADGFFEMYKGEYTVGIDIPSGEYELSSDENLLLRISRAPGSKVKGMNTVLDAEVPRVFGLFDGDSISFDGDMRFTKKDIRG